MKYSPCMVSGCTVNGTYTLHILYYVILLTISSASDPNSEWPGHAACTKMFLISHLISAACYVACRVTEISAYLNLQRFSSPLMQTFQQSSLYYLHSSVTDFVIPLNSVYDLSLR